MSLVTPTNVIQVDDRAGNAYTIADFVHNFNVAQTFNVEQSVTTVVHVTTAGQTAITPTIATSGQTGIKVVTIPTASATGTYTLIMRHTGSAAGVGSYKPT